MTTKKSTAKAETGTEQKNQYEDLIKAIAKANNHPDPESWTSEVLKNLEGGE